MKSEIRQHKHQTLLNRLDQGMTCIFINSECENVSLPPHLMNQPQVVLNLSYQFHLKLFEINRWGVEASVSFSGQPFHCRLPWDCIYYIQSANQREEGIFYFEGLPDRMAQKFQGLIAEKQRLEAQPTDDTEDSPLEYRPSPHLEKPYEPKFSFCDDEDFYEGFEDEDESEDSEENEDPSSWVNTLPHIQTQANPRLESAESEKKTEITFEFEPLEDQGGEDR